MEHNDTINLIQETYSGTEMAIASIDEVLDKVQDPNLKNILQNSLEKHEQINAELKEQLKQLHTEQKGPSPVAKGMSWIQTNVKMTMDYSDATVADLMTDGCNMGIKTLNRYINQYPKAGEKAIHLSNKLIELEQQLEAKLKPFL